MSRQQHRAETASGQLVKQTCKNLHAEMREMRNSDMKELQDEPLYAAMSKMCQKLGTKKVHSKDLQKRCDWLADMKSKGKADAYKSQMWYSRLDKACAFMDHEQLDGFRFKKKGSTVMV